MRRTLIRSISTLLLAAGWIAAGQAHAADRSGVAASPQEIRPLLIGAEIPDVTVRDAAGADVALADVFRKEPTILIVYRGGW